MNPLTIFAKRFVAGERPQDAVRAGERLLAKGIKATFDQLTAMPRRDALMAMAQGMKGG